MGSFVTWLQGLVRPMKPWVTVKPWEQGVRVRCGKHVRLLPPGMFWKMPFFDSVSVLPIRVRVMQVPTQTVTTSDGKAITLGMALQYQIEDVEKVFRSVHHPEQTLMFWAQGIAAEHIRAAGGDAVTPDAIRDAIESTIDVAAMGLGEFRVFITDLALVRTFRLIQDGRWSSDQSVDSMGHEA